MKKEDIILKFKEFSKKIFSIIKKVFVFLFVEEADENNSSLYNTIKNIIIALIIAFSIRSVFVEPFHIPSGSMKPGLLEGDYIFVSKYDFGYSRYSFPFGLPIFKNRIFFNKNKVKRGDVIVFRLPSKPSINYIKRLIGLPGDKIQMKDGVLYINDKEISKEYIKDDLEYEDLSFSVVKLYKEIIDDKEVFVFDKNSYSDGDNTIPFYIPENHYFFMGDNRDNSLDSRFKETGYISEEFLIGKARMIFLSSKENPLKFWKWHKILRFKRFFKKIK